MFSIRIIAVCIAVALICACIRNIRPEIAAAISLAAGTAVIFMLWHEADRNMEWVAGIRHILRGDNFICMTLAKATGIALIADLGAQVCQDAGEHALAGRICLAARIAMLAMGWPMFVEITESIGRILS